ncbi:hypothetical protein ACNO7P_09625 [Bisgaard Taxon 45]
MISHIITFPDNTEIEFFASDERSFDEVFSNPKPAERYAKHTLTPANKSRAQKKRVSKRKKGGKNASK